MSVLLVHFYLDHSFQFGGGESEYFHPVNSGRLFLGGIAGSPIGGIIMVNPIRSDPAIAAGGNGDPSITTTFPWRQPRRSGFRRRLEKLFSYLRVVIPATKPG
jgi:hypothetical protein